METLSNTFKSVLNSIEIVDPDGSNPFTLADVEIDGQLFRMDTLIVRRFYEVFQSYFQPGIVEIMRERADQIYRHGFTAAHDNLNKSDELFSAVLFCLTLDEGLWPLTWNRKWMTKMQGKSLRSRLISAGALLAAEIDRIDRDRNLSMTAYSKSLK